MEKNITVRLTARLFAEEKCYGPGVEQLLKAVEKHRSLRAAAASMSMAYSKAWSIIRAAEQGFGVLFFADWFPLGGLCVILSQNDRR